MAGPLIADRVRETTLTAGTGAVNLEGPLAGFRGFVAAIGDSNTCFYMISDGTDWEVGQGTITSGAPDSLSRDTVLASSNAGALVVFATGTKEVIATLPAHLLSQRFAKVTLNPATSISDVALTPVQWTGPAVSADNPYGLWAGPSPTRLTADLAGLYVVELGVVWALGSTGRREASIELNGTTQIAADSKPAIGGGTMSHSLSVPLRLVAGNYVEARVQHSEGSPLLVGGLIDTYFSLRRVGT